MYDSVGSSSYEQNILLCTCPLCKPGKVLCPKVEMAMLIYCGSHRMLRVCFMVVVCLWLLLFL